MTLEKLVNYMSTITANTETSALETEWKMLAIAGGIVAILGVLAAALPFVTGVATTYLVGSLLVLGGLVHGSRAVATRGQTGTLWQLTLAAVSVLGGIAALVNPIVGLLTLTLLVIAYLFADAVVEFGAALRMGRESGRGWIAASGALSLALAVLLLAGFPADAVWVVGLAVGANLFVTGLSMVAVAYGGRRLAHDVTPPTGESRSA